jgi:hypothetical protein
VQIISSEADVYEYLPDKVFNQTFTVLLFNVAAQIMVLTVLHHDVDLIIENKRVDVAYNIIIF